MKKIFYRIASTALAAVFFAGQSPVLAQELANSLAQMTGSATAVEPEILGEVTEKRSGFTKHFRMSDGSMTAVTYADPVHYKDGNKFKEIDNTLTSSENDSYQNTDNPFKVKFAKRFKNKNLVTVNSDGHEISWSYIKKKYKEELQTKTQEETSISNGLKAIPDDETGARDAKIENFKDKTQFANKKEEKTNVNKVYSKSKYEAADEDIDLDYTVSGLKLKENIILNKKSDNNNRFDFEFNTNGLEIKKDEIGNLNFVDKNGKVVYIMPKGSMWDSGKGFSNDVDYEFSKTENGYIVSVIPNKEWINSEDRLYPIMIDPSIQTELENSSYEYAHTDQNSPDIVYCNYNHLPVGYAYNSHYATLFKYNQLPAFSHGEIITGTTIKLKIPSSYSDLSSYVGSISNKIAVKEITNDWHASTLTYNTRPTTSSIVTDYTLTDSVDKWYQWDITKLAKRWYTLSKPNNNLGFQFETLEPNNASMIRFVSKNNTQYPNDGPRLTINYKEFVGEEDYWSYTSHSAGLNGSGQVNNYAGTLSVSENVLSYSGSRNPVSITNTYNNVNYNEHSNGYIHTTTFAGGYSHSSSTGLGFRMNFNQLIYPIAAIDPMYSDGWRYVYVDGDGTQHYFKTDGAVFTDEDGLGLTITNNNGVLELTDLKDNKLTFEKILGVDANYVLKTSGDNNKILDGNGNETSESRNKIIYNYDYQPGTSNAKVSRITDAAGRETYIAYTNGMISSVVDSDNKTTTFTYNGEKLTEITYPDGLKTGYVYDQQGRLSGVWTNEGTGSSVGYEYASNDFESSNFFKIRSVTEYGSQNFDPKTAGNSVNFSYEMNQTRITHKINNLNVPYHENTEIWQFDNTGRMTAVMDEDGNMLSNIYESATTGGKKNKVKHSNDCGKYTNNLLKNTAAANGFASWEVDNWKSGGNPANYSVIDTTETTPSLGQKCFKVSQNATNPSWPIARQRVSIPSSSQDRKYTLSADVKINDALSGGDGASLHIASFGADGQQLSGDGYSEWLKTTDGAWRRVSVTITAPAGATEIECCFGMKESVGSAYFDCLQLEESDIANDYNMVENSSFDSGLNSWTSENLEPGDGVVDGRVKLTGNPGLAKNIYQVIPINKINPVFALRATAQGVAVPQNSIKSEVYVARYYVPVLLTFSDSTSVWIDNYFNSDVADTQSLYTSIRASDYGAGKTVTSIRINPAFHANCNTIYFDNIQVCVDDAGTTYEHNDKGSVISITDNTGNKTTLDRDATSDEVTKITDPRSNETDFSYNSGTSKPHQLANSTIQTPGGDVKNNISYDQYGNITASQDQDAPAQGKSVTSSASYTSNKEYNYTESTTDSRGKVTTFDYNQNNGNLNSVTDPKSVTTNFTYDTVGRLLTATCGGSQNVYSYANGILSSLSHKVSESANVAYNFVRDIFGNVTSTKVGNQTLSTSTYDAGNGLLRQVKYANNQCVNYDYDQSGRLAKKYYGYGKAKKNGEFEYIYDNKDRLVETFDPENNLTTNFEYDKFGRLASVRRSDGTLSDVKYNSLESSLIDKVTSQLFGITQTIENTFGEGNMLENSKITVGSTSIWNKYNYDALSRVQSTETLNSNETTGVKHEVSYVDVGANNTTGLVGSVELKKKVSGNWVELNKKWNYEYDDVGNITNIKDKNSDLIVHYDYDNLNQLTRENNVNLNKTIIYSYDLGGNIQEKKIYAYTTGDLSGLTPENTVVYGYDDSNWKDKMTSYNGQEIIYDAIGNPLAYRNGMQFEWSHGRRLEKASNLSYNVSYKYDDGGIRTSKTVGGTTTEFITSGIQVLAQKTGNNVLIWQIDGNGQAVGFNYNNVQYFYLKNAQGDIVGITDASGNIVAEYVYDSWGKVLHVLNATGTEITDPSHIAHINPLRYRGYYYDSELGLYYLNARYYDPEIGRFLNADSNINGGLNLFAYCSNNPVMFEDFTGEFKILSGNRIQITKGDTLWGIAKALTGNGANWEKLGYKGNTSKLRIGAILNVKSLPPKGKPNSKVKTPDGKIEREYGPDGRAKTDKHNTDHGHPKNHPVPHKHEWDWRDPEHPDPGPPQALIVGAAAAGTAYLIYRGIRMLPSLLPPLWPTIPANVVLP